MSGVIRLTLFYRIDQKADESGEFGKKMTSWIMGSESKQFLENN